MIERQPGNLLTPYPNVPLTFKEGGLAEGPRVVGHHSGSNGAPLILKEAEYIVSHEGPQVYLAPSRSLGPAALFAAHTAYQNKHDVGFNHSRRYGPPNVQLPGDRKAYKAEIKALPPETKRELAGSFDRVTIEGRIMPLSRRRKVAVAYAAHRAVVAALNDGFNE